MHGSCLKSNAIRLFIMNVFNLYHCAIKKLPLFDGIPAFLIRLFLAPVFIMAGYTKMQFGDPDVSGLANFLANPNIVDWFGNPDYGLGLPLPFLLANLAAWSEFFGGWLLLVGLATRLMSIPLMVTMVVAATTVHLDNGWFAITPTNADTSAANVFHWLGSDTATASLENSEEASKRLNIIRNIVEENGNPDWLYETGNVVILNNGIEFASTYFIMLLALFFIGAGRYTSIDYYILQQAKKQCDKCKAATQP